MSLINKPCKYLTWAFNRQQTQLQIYQVFKPSYNNLTATINTAEGQPLQICWYEAALTDES